MELSLLDHLLRFSWQTLALDLVEDFDWTSEKDWKQLKIVDLACGSGTLLAASLAEMRRRARDANANRELVNRLHRIGVEQVLKGFDINPISLQLAAAQLSIGNAEIRFGRMGLHRMPYGPNPSTGRISAGSLEFLAQQEILPKDAREYKGRYSSRKRFGRRPTKDLRRESVNCC